MLVPLQNPCKKNRRQTQEYQRWNPINRSIIFSRQNSLPSLNACWLSLPTDILTFPKSFIRLVTTGCLFIIPLQSYWVENCKSPTGFFRHGPNDDMDNYKSRIGFWTPLLLQGLTHALWDGLLHVWCFYIFVIHCPSCIPMEKKTLKSKKPTLILATSGLAHAPY